MIYFDTLLLCLPIIYLFDPEDIDNNPKFTQDDKNFIKKLYELFQHLYFLETGQEITKDNEEFDVRSINSFKDIVAGRQNDSWRECEEYHLKTKFCSVTGRVKFKFSENLSESVYLYKEKHINNSIKNFKPTEEILEPTPILNKLKFD